MNTRIESAKIRLTGVHPRSDFQLDTQVNLYKNPASSENRVAVSPRVEAIVRRELIAGKTVWRCHVHQNSIHQISHRFLILRRVSDIKKADRSPP